MFYHIGTVIAFLLPALSEGAHCGNGALPEREISEYILNPVNEYRKTLIDGKQKNGDSGQNLPPPKGMTLMVWDCDLEKEAVNILAGGCYDYVDEPPVPNDKARVFFSGYADSLPNSAEAIKNLLTISLGEIDSHALDGVVNGATSVIYKSGNVDYLLNYFTLMRTSNTKIGCAWRKCTKDRSELINVLCTLNSQTLKEGDVIYEVGKAGECTDCPPGTTCDPNTKLCVSGTTTSSTQKTNPPTTTTLAPNPPTTTTLAPNPPTTTTLAPNPPTTTTIAPSPGASFPTGTSTQCPDNKMTDALRNQFLKMHNARRSSLAKGEIAKNTGNLLPKSSNMLKMKYDCTLEQGAIQWASQCGSAGSPESTRQGVGENFKRFPAANFPTFADATKKAVTEWWKVVRKVPGIGMAATFRPHHVGTPIESFTQMGWALSGKLGCSIVKCSSEYVGVCRYSPKGNNVGQSVYKVGNVCSACPSGASCNPSEALCVV